LRALWCTQCHLNCEGSSVSRLPSRSVPPANSLAHALAHGLH
jgi:hypothetical protein